MDEYNMELKAEWIRGLQNIPYTSAVSALFQEVPKPGNIDELVSILPLWKLLPLHCKFPGIKGMKFTRGSFGTSSKTEPQSLDFITYDPYCYEVNTNYYDSLYDKHLKNYFKSEVICNFLRKIGVLDDKNQPICSLKDINSYRFFLSRIHKDAVKREYNRLLDERIEKNLWKKAQLGTVNTYFKRLQREKSLNLTSTQRQVALKERRNKRLKAIENIKKREKRLADREEDLRKQQIINKEVIMRKRNKYAKVLARGKELAKVRPIKTIVKIRKQFATKDEILKNKKVMSKLKRNFDTERNLLNKTFAQINSLHWWNEIATVQEKSRQLRLERRLKQDQRAKQRMQNRIQRAKAKKGLPMKTKTPKDRVLAIKDKRNIANKGVPYIVDELRKIDKGESLIEDGAAYLRSEKHILRKVARQMIRRAVYLNLKHLCQHFVNLMIDIFFQILTKNINGKLPSFKDITNFLHKFSSSPDSKKDLLDAKTLGSAHARYLDEPISTDYLRDHLLQKKQLLRTLHKNASSLFELIRHRVLLLLCVGDPFIEMPQLRKKIMESRKVMTITDLQNSLLRLLVTTDKRKFFTSELGRIAAVFSYAFLLKTRKIINYDKRILDSSSECSIKIRDISVWEMIKSVFRYMQKEYNNYKQNSERTIVKEKNNGKITKFQRKE
uniref:Uncharacterized protein n=1 Tax=Rhodnius prolixus TaxID=13249 RepID=T1HME1_RHOPR